MEIKNKTVLTQDEFVKSLAYGSKANTKRAYISVFSCLLLVILAIIYYCIKKDIFAIVIIIFGLILAGFGLFVIFGTPYIIKKNNSYFKNGVTYNYLFKDDEVVIESIVGEKKGVATYKYQDLYKITINKDFLLLFLDNATVFCCKLAAFEESSTELLELLKPYQVVKKRRK